MSTLHDALNFTDDELALNQRGRLSRRQAQRLGRDASRLRWYVLLGAVASGTVGLILFLLGHEPEGAMALALGGSLWYGRAFVGPRRGDVQTLSGCVSRVAVPSASRGDGASPRYHLCVDAIDLDVPARVCLAFEPGRRYHVHVAPDARGRPHVVSAERVDA